MRMLTEPARQIPVVDQVDVLVAGGGPAGIAAAVAAARSGARTLLVERYGYLGGLATGGLVLFMDGLFDSQGVRCIDGIAWESLERLRGIGGLAADNPTSLHVDSELLKVVADEMCVESGVGLRLHSWAVDALVEDNRVTGVIVESKSGRQAILGQVCVDATGDGDIAARAGADFELCTMRIGLNLKIGGVDSHAYGGFMGAEPEEAARMRREVRALGGCPIGLGATPHSDIGVYWVNILGLARYDQGDDPAVTGPPAEAFKGELNAVDVDDLTYAEVELRCRIMIGLDFYRKHVPGYQDVRLLSWAPQLGVRDSRRVRGVHRLTRAELEGGTQFGDAIGMTAERFASGEHLPVPYRALVPETVDGLLTSGRCISVDDGLIHAIRIIPPCMMIGQAAGTAAAMCAQQGVRPRDLDVRSLRERLTADRVMLP